VPVIAQTIITVPFSILVLIQYYTASCVGYGVRVSNVM